MKKAAPLQLTNLDKVYWPKARYTKGDLVRYYHAMAPVLLPYLKGRPLVAKRFPDGIAGQGFFQKNAGAQAPPFVRTVSVAARTLDKRVDYIVCDDAETLVYLGQLGAIELHPWGSRVGALDKPDCMLFDLDPGARTPFSRVVETAREVKKILDACKLPSMIKTSGKRGLHICVPLKPRASYDAVRHFAARAGHLAARRRPDCISMEAHPAKRKDKVFVDCMRNAFGQTAVAAYSLRATPEASVSAPLAWREVTGSLDPKKFTIRNIRARVAQQGDLWRGALRGTNELGPARKLLARLEGVQR